MTDRSSRLTLARLGVAAAALTALVAMAACNPKPATNTTSNTTTTSTNSTTTVLATPGAPVNSASLAPPVARNSAPGAVIPIPGQSGPAGSADAGSLGDNAAGTTGAAPSASGGAPQDTPDQSDQANLGDNSNSDYDKNFINACFRRAGHSTGSVQEAADYCTCVMADLDKLSLPQKQALKPNSPQLISAENDCKKS